MYFPHKYRTLNGRAGGTNGFPVDYEYNVMNSIELYNLDTDISETNDVAEDYPDIVKVIELLADAMRNELGDKLYNIKGKENRDVGRVD
jgi:arylsulfatase